MWLARTGSGHIAGEGIGDAKGWVAGIETSEDHGGRLRGLGSGGTNAIKSMAWPHSAQTTAGRGGATIWTDEVSQ